MYASEHACSTCVLYTCEQYQSQMLIADTTIVYALCCDTDLSDVCSRPILLALQVCIHHMHALRM
jgi:hypothetical protein